MVEADACCIDVLTQISAATKALEAVALALLEDHVTRCVADAAREGGVTAEAKVKEASDAIARLPRRCSRPLWRSWTPLTGRRSGLVRS